MVTPNMQQFEAAQALADMAREWRETAARLKAVQSPRARSLRAQCFRRARMAERRVCVAANKAIIEACDAIRQKREKGEPGLCDQCGLWHA